MISSIRKKVYIRIEIDEIIERNMAEGSVDQAVYELQDWTADNVAEYAGSITNMDRPKAMFIRAIEDEMRGADGW